MGKGEIGMREVNVENLEGVALDWAVAKATDSYVYFLPFGVNGKGDTIFTVISAGVTFSPSISWLHGGPLIEKFNVTFDWMDQVLYWAETSDSSVPMPGPNHLIAACRAIVASKEGETVNIPSELL